MLRILFFLLMCQISYGQIAATYIVPVKYSFSSSNPFQVVLKWDFTNNTSAVVLYKKKFTDGAWTTLTTLTGNDTTYTDNSFMPGVKYEYMIRKTISGNFAYGNIAAGENAPADHDRGYCMVICDSGLQSRIPTYIDRFKLDLIKDGYRIHSIVTNNNQPVADVKMKIIQWFQSHTGNSPHAVVLIGKVPIPYSGNLNPDAHPEHKGAWPADGFYGDIDNDVWSDVNVNTNSNPTLPARVENKNLPGDGKFDESSFGSILKVAVGRIYLDSLSSMGVSADSLYKRYFDKVYKFKNGMVKVPRKACIEDRLGILGGEVPGRNVFQNAYALVGKDSTVVASSNFLSLVKNNKYIFAQASSTGGYTQNVGIATSSQVKDSMNAVFQGYFGSYFGDWDNNNNFLRSAIAGDGINLTSIWGGRPQWYFHHMTLGSTVGFSTLETQNNFVSSRTLYYQGASAAGVHVSLMGDPTLHMHIVTPPSALIISKQDSNRNVKLTWTSSNDAVLKYYIYRADSLMGKFSLSDSVSSSTLNYLDTMPKIGKSYYMVKACKNETTPYGSYNNLSLGTFASVDSVAAKPKINPSSLSNNTLKVHFIFNRENREIQIHGLDHSEYKLTIIDMQGKSVKSSLARHAEWINISELSPGAYIVQVDGFEQVFNNKIILE